MARKSVIFAAIHNIISWTAALTLAVTKVFAFSIVIARTNDRREFSSCSKYVFVVI